MLEEKLEMFLKRELEYFFAQKLKRFRKNERRRLQ